MSMFASHNNNNSPSSKPAKKATNGIANTTPTTTTTAKKSPQLAATPSTKAPATQTVNPVPTQNDNDSSSNDVLIVLETSGQQLPGLHKQPLASASTVTANNSSSSSQPKTTTLTEELLAEHNKQHGTLNTGGGTFSSHTRDYISKWALEYKHTEEKPFACGLIPIESFGVKILNEPQYLLTKSKVKKFFLAYSRLMDRIYSV